MNNPMTMQTITVTITLTETAASVDRVGDGAVGVGRPLIHIRLIEYIIITYIYGVSLDNGRVQHKCNLYQYNYTYNYRATMI